MRTFIDIMAETRDRFEELQAIALDRKMTEEENDEYISISSAYIAMLKAYIKNK